MVTLLCNNNFTLSPNGDANQIGLTSSHSKNAWVVSRWTHPLQKVFFRRQNYVGNTTSLSLIGSFRQVCNGQKFVGKTVVGNFNQHNFFCPWETICGNSPTDSFRQKFQTDFFCRKFPKDSFERNFRRKFPVAHF